MSCRGESTKMGLPARHGSSPASRGVPGALGYEQADDQSNIRGKGFTSAFRSKLCKIYAKVDSVGGLSSSTSCMN